MKVKRKIKWKNILLLLFILILIIIFIISLVNIIKWLIDSNKINNEMDVIEENTKVIEIEDSNNTEIINNVEFI